MRMMHYQASIDRESLKNQSDHTDCNPLMTNETLSEDFFRPIIDILAELFKQNTPLP